MNALEKREYYAFLFDFYGGLLTEKQRQYFCHYYFSDLSLMEIANIYGISRTAVYDQLTKTYKYLDSFEEKLKLFYRFQERSKLYKCYNRQNAVTDELIEKLKEIE